MPNSDRLIRGLATLAAIAYVGLWAAAIVVLVAAPVVKSLASGDPEWTWGLQVPATLLDADATVLTSWGPARVEVQDVRGDLRLPLDLLPWSLFAVLWVHAAVVSSLMLLFLYHLKRIFQRVRDGAPFDADNVLRLRWLGLLLAALAVFNGVVELVTSLAVRRGLESGPIAVPIGLHVNGSVVFVALVLLVLAEIFRRGAELEHEQSLVV